MSCLEWKRCQARMEFSAANAQFCILRESSWLRRSMQAVGSMYIILLLYRLIEQYAVIGNIQYSKQLTIKIQIQVVKSMNVFYFVKRWPRNNESAAAEKVVSLLETLANIGHKVTVLSDQTTNPQQLPIKQYPITLASITPNKISSSLSATKTKPDLAIFNSYEMEEMYSIYLYNKWNKCLKMLEINRLDALQEWRKKKYKSLVQLNINGVGQPMYPLTLQEAFTPRQLSCIYRSDYYLCGNEFMYFYLKKYLKGNNMAINNSGYPLGEYKTEINSLMLRPFQRRKHFYFMGNFNKEETIINIEILTTQIWPLIRSKLTDCELHIYGAGFNKEIQSKKKSFQKMGIILKGFLDSFQDIQRYKALLVPKQYQCGVKGVITEAWFYHTPVVTTPVGAEGLFLETIQPKFTTYDAGEVQSSFFNERTLSKSQSEGKAKILNYYEENKFSDKINELSFGGICNNFSFDDFVSSAILIYTNKEVWEKCMQISRKILVKNQCEDQQQINIKYAISQVEMAIYNGRKGVYEQEWKKYTKSKELHQRLSKK